MTQPGLRSDADVGQAPSGEGWVTAGWLAVAFAAMLAFIWWIVMWSPLGLARQYNYLIGGDVMKDILNTVMGGFTVAPAVAGALFIPWGMYVNWRAKRLAGRGQAT